jgi:SanA protein
MLGESNDIQSLFCWQEKESGRIVYREYFAHSLTQSICKISNMFSKQQWLTSVSLNINFTLLIRKLFYILSVLTVLTAIVVLICNWQVRHKTAPYLFQDASLTPHNKTGLVLGTSKRLSNGMPNQYFYNRISAAIELYQAGKIDRIIISGDNSTRYYNEPQDMKEALMEKGIPEPVIYLDYAGFRTLDSVIRCKEIFGQNQITVISQRFHNARAVFIARHHHIEAIGYNADDVKKAAGLKTNVREVLARVKLFIDLYLIHQQPKFLGEKIKIE